MVCTSAVKDLALIRRQNLSGVKPPPGRTLVATLVERVGGRDSYWRSLLSDPSKSFGEKIARKIEEKWPLPHLSLDSPTKRAAGAAPPPTPPRNFADRRVLTDEEWELWQAFKQTATDKEVDDFRQRYEKAKQAVEQLYQERMAAAKNGTPPRTRRQVTIGADPGNHMATLSDPKAAPVKKGTKH